RLASPFPGAGLGGGSAPAGRQPASRAEPAARAPRRAPSRASESPWGAVRRAPRSRHEKAAERNRLLARGGAGRGRPPGSVTRRACLGLALMSLPGRRVRVRRRRCRRCHAATVADRDAAPAGRSGERAGAVRVGRARRRAGRPRARLGSRLPG
ncbi:PREDICTED: uncharacterized protein LOC106900467, partial [Calidris pugnax]|uniref:uncharacterized protein LOC106900467 n=1 Tax=Calidris pugnax TaxID=198806 RepID=UPI00071CD8A5